MDSGRLEGHSNGRGSVADRFGSPLAARNLAELSLEHLAGEVEVDLIADVKGKRQMDDDRQGLRQRGWVGGEARSSPPFRPRLIFGDREGETRPIGRAVRRVQFDRAGPQGGRVVAAQRGRRQITGCVDSPDEPSTMDSWIDVAGS